MFVPSDGEEWATALEWADKAQDAAKAHGKDQLRVYYSGFVDRMKQKGKHQSEWCASSEMLKAGCVQYTGKMW